MPSKILDTLGTCVLKSVRLNSAGRLSFPSEPRVFRFGLFVLQGNQTKLRRSSRNRHSAS